MSAREGLRLGVRFDRDMEIVRDGQVEATNDVFSLGDRESALELPFNHDGRSYEAERPPYQVREGGSWLCFVRDPDGYSTTLS